MDLGPGHYCLIKKSSGLVMFGTWRVRNAFGKGSGSNETCCRQGADNYGNPTSGEVEERCMYYA